jgi:hypothetical protein
LKLPKKCLLEPGPGLENLLPDRKLPLAAPQELEESLAARQKAAGVCGIS